jgi:aspartate-semialdehyde dehydrogenase
MKVAVVGATGMVGRVMLQLLEERNFKIDELIPVASKKSVGKTIVFKGQNVVIKSMQAAIDSKCNVALFSAGGDISLNWAPKFAASGTTVIDNSSAFRMNPVNKLVVPEINASELTKEDKIIANPNCSTIQMVMALAPIHKKYGVKRVVVSTYQSISGTGKAAVEQMNNERNGVEGDMVYPHKIDMNCLPHCDVFMDNGYTKEEMKIMNETKKILSDDSIKVTATAVRVPVSDGHSESVNVTLNSAFEVDEIRYLLSHTEGITVSDDIKNNVYPTPLTAHQKDDVFVGRIRRDDTLDNSLNMWIVADNLRKGAATNAIQIAEYLVAKNMV